MHPRDIRDLTVVAYARNRLEEPLPVIVVSPQWVETIPGPPGRKSRFRSRPAGSRVLVLRPEPGNLFVTAARDGGGVGGALPGDVRLQCHDAREDLGVVTQVVRTPAVRGWRWEAVPVEYLLGAFSIVWHRWQEEQRWIDEEQARVLLEGESVLRRAQVVALVLGVDRLRRLDVRRTDDPELVVSLTVLERLIRENEALRRPVPARRKS
jgi:hypothetical protein